MSVSSLGAEARQKFPFESNTSRQFGKLLRFNKRLFARVKTSISEIKLKMSEDYYWTIRTKSTHLSLSKLFIDHR